MLHPLASRKLVLQTVEDSEKQSKVAWTPKSQKHAYTYNKGVMKVELWKSVTAFKEIYFPFDEEAISLKLSKQFKNRPHPKYHNKSQAEIMWMWFEGAGLGTIVHDKQEKHTLFGTVPTENEMKYTLENWRNGETDDIGMDREYYLLCMKVLKLDLFSEKHAANLIRQFNYGLMYKKKMNEWGYETYSYVVDPKRNLKSKAAEIRIFNELMNIGGTLDELWYNPKTKKFIVSDWKCSSKKIVKINLQKTNPHFLKKITDYTKVFSDLQNLVEKRQFWANKSYIGYALQLSLYHYILKTCYKNDTDFQYDCDEIHIVRLWHEEDGPQVVSFRSDLFEDRIKKIEELLTKQK
jgi:hypothetical protein